MTTEAERHAVEMHRIMSMMPPDDEADLVAHVVGLVGYQLALLNDNMERLVDTVRDAGLNAGRMP